MNFKNLVYAMEKCVDRVNAMFLEQYVLFKMQEKLQEDGELEKLRIEAVSRLNKEIKELKDKRSLLSARIQKIKQQNFEAYQDYACGKTDSFHSDEIMVKSVVKELDDLNKDVQKMEAAYIKMECERDSLSTGSQFAVLSREMIDHYIDKVMVYDEQHIEIFWKEKASVV